MSRDLCETCRQDLQRKGPRDCPTCGPPSREEMSKLKARIVLLETVVEAWDEWGPGGHFNDALARARRIVPPRDEKDIEYYDKVSAYPPELIERVRETKNSFLVRYVTLLDELLWQRAAYGILDDATEERFAVALNDYRRAMSPEDEVRLAEIVAFETKARGR